MMQTADVTPVSAESASHASILSLASRGYRIVVLGPAPPDPLSG